MTGGLREAASLMAIAALLCVGATVFGAKPAKAADLGGDCCADLEERVAELEATTVRKGNKKVSVQIDGKVNYATMWWDDGGESNIYLHGLGPTQATHVKFTGEAQFAPGWTAGYTLRIQNLSDNPFGRNASTGQAIDQASADFSQGLNVQMSYWYLQNKKLGKTSVGRQANAAKSAAMFTDQSGTPRFIGSASAPVDVNQWTLDISHSLGKKDQLHSYYAIQQGKTKEPTRSGNTIPGFGYAAPLARQIFTLSETHTFGPATVNDARFGFNRWSTRTTPNAQFNPAEFGIHNGIDQPIGLPFGMTMLILGIWLIGFAHYFRPMEPHRALCARRSQSRIGREAARGRGRHRPPS